MNGPGTLLAILIPTISGMIILTAFSKRPIPFSLRLGGGYLLGIAVVGGLMALFGMLGSRFDWVYTTASLGVMAGVAWIVRYQTSSVRTGEAPIKIEWRWESMLLTALVILIATLSYAEISVRPLMGWDAWTVWWVKPRSWFFGEPDLDFVMFPQWLASTDPNVVSTAAAHYPELIGRVILWQARWAGGFIESLAGLMWVGAWLSMIAVAHGIARMAQLDARTAAIIAGLLAMAPFPAVHMALYGYMDLWVAAQQLLAAGLMLLWLRDREPGVLLLATVMVLAVACTKIEGSLWAIAILVATTSSFLSTRNFWIAAASLVAVVGIWAFAGGITTDTWAVTPDLIKLPYIGEYALAFDNRLLAMSRSLIELPNWHVLGILAGLLLLGCALSARQSRWNHFAATHGLITVALLIFIFNWTPAGMWAESLTASNRLTLHLLPTILVICATVLLARPTPDEEPATHALASDAS